MKGAEVGTDRALVGWVGSANRNVDQPGTTRR
jgi:hypothetical protein